MNASRSHYCKEMEFIVLCCNPAIDNIIKENISCIIEDNIDWNLVISKACAHGVIPLLYHNLKTYSLETVPKEVFEDLRQRYLGNTSRNLMLSKELLTILKIFEEYNIQAVPFKGALLAKQAYNDISLRWFSDLDIMVHKKDVLKVKDILISDGFKPHIQMNPYQEKYLLRNDCEYNFIGKNPRVFVEIHWRFHPKMCSINHDQSIWSHLQTIQFENASVNSFSIEDQILYLCAHATRHQWSQLRLIRDVTGLLVNYDIDWEKLLSSAQKQGLLRILNLGIQLCHIFYNIKIPGQIQSKIKKDPVSQKLAKYIHLNLITANTSFLGEHNLFLFWPKTREHIKDKTISLLTMAFSPTKEDFQTKHLPTSLMSLYYLMRPYRLIQRYGFKKGYPR